MAFGWGNRRESLDDGVGDGVEGSGRGLSNEAFDLGEDLFDRIEVGRIFRKEQETGSSGLDGLSHRLSFVRSEIVEHDDVVGLERWDQKLLDIGAKALAVDGTVEHTGRFDAVVAQRGQEGRGLPFALRDLVDEALAARGKSRRAVSCWS